MLSYGEKKDVVIVRRKTIREQIDYSDCVIVAQCITMEWTRKERSKVLVYALHHRLNQIRERSEVRERELGRMFQSE